MLTFWFFKNLFIYCGNKFGDFHQNIGDFLSEHLVTLASLCKYVKVMCFPFQYATTMRNMQRDSVRGMWDSDWLPNVSGKQAIYNGLAQYHQSRICNAQKAVGEEIAR